MLVTKCDICKREIKGEIVLAGIGIYPVRQSFCLKCGKPVADFLNEKLNNKKIKNGKQKRKK